MSAIVWVGFSEMRGDLASSSDNTVRVVILIRICGKLEKLLNSVFRNDQDEIQIGGLFPRILSFYDVVCPVYSDSYKRSVPIQPEKITLAEQ